jgi:hypothetical protein
VRCWPQLQFLQQLCGQAHMWWRVRESVRDGIGVAGIVYKCQPQWHCHQLLSGHYRLQVPILDSTFANLLQLSCVQLIE